MSAPPAAWERLGRLLEQRRVELDTRYRNRVLFAAERNIDYRLSWDIETGARTNYRRSTLTAIEVAYGWVPGSIQAVLAGGEPSPVPRQPASGAHLEPELTVELLTAEEKRQLDEWRAEIPKRAAELAAERERGDRTA